MQDVFKQYEEEISRSKSDCKGSNFRGLRNLNMEIVSSLLRQIINKNLPLKQLNTKCQEIKKIETLKKKFVQLVGELNWEEAQKKYPEFAIEDKLKEKFLSTKQMHLFEDYCKKAMRYMIYFVIVQLKASVVQSLIIIVKQQFLHRYKEVAFVPETTEETVYLKSNNGSYACFIYTKPDSLSYLSIKKLMPACNGFPLSLINIDSEGPDCISQV